MTKAKFTVFFNRWMQPMLRPPKMMQMLNITKCMQQDEL